MGALGAMEVLFVFCIMGCSLVYELHFFPLLVNGATSSWQILRS